MSYRVRHREGRAEIFADGFFLQVDIIDEVLHYILGEEDFDYQSMVRHLPPYNGPRHFEVRAQGPFVLDDSRLTRPLDGLTKLDLSGNNLTVLPEGIETLSNLRQLNLAGNNLKDLPSGLVSLRSLERVDMTNNNLKEVPQTVMEMTSLSHINLSCNQITPDIMFPKRSWRHLKHLDLSANYCIKKIPVSIMNLRNLKSLCLYNCLLEEIPSTIGRLEYLETLGLGNNRLTQVPKSIKGCMGLQKLYLENNRLCALPLELFELRSLEKLQVRRNNIAILPKEIWKLISLKQLDLCHNQLIGLPRELELCHKLKFLFVQHNLIKHFPFPLITKFNFTMWVEGNVSPVSHQREESPLSLQAQAAGSIVNMSGKTASGMVPPGLRLALEGTQKCDSPDCRRLTTSWHRTVVDDVSCKATRHSGEAGRVNLEALVCSNRCARACKLMSERQSY